MPRVFESIFVRLGAETATTAMQRFIVNPCISNVVVFAGLGPRRVHGTYGSWNFRVQ